MRKLFVMTCLAMFAAASVTLAADRTYNLKMHHPGPTDHPYHKGAETFKELTEKYSEGTIIIDIFPNNELASGSQAVEAVQFGTIDIALESSMAVTNFERSFGVLDMPFLFPDRATVYEALDGEVGNELAKNLENSADLKVLYYWDNGFRNISNSKKPINTPADLEGLKIRVPESKVFITTFETLKAIPTPMAFNELFAALQLKTVDGQENPNGHMIAYKLHEVQPFFSITNHIYTAEPLLIAKNMFDEFSPAQQEAILRAAREAGDVQRKLSANMESEYLRQIKEEGVHVATPDLAPFRAAVQPVYNSYAADFGKYIEKILN